MVRNFIPKKGGYLERKTAAQLIISAGNAAAEGVIANSAVRRIIDFRYQDAQGGDHQELLWIKDNGRIYREERGGEIESYPRFYLRGDTDPTDSGSVANEFNAVDDKIDTFAAVVSAPAIQASLTIDSFQNTARVIDSISVVSRTEVTVNVTTATASYSTNAGSSWTDFYSVGTTRALQDDSATLSATQEINDMQARVVVAAGGVSTTNFYDSRLECTWTGGRVLSNPRDVAWVVANNKLFISDGDQTLVYLGQRNGGGWYVWGTARPDKPVCDVVGNSTLTFTTGRKYSVSWVHLEDGFLIHESSRSDISDCKNATNQFYRIHRPISPPERTTHWRLYCSPLDGAQTQYRTATIEIDTLFYDDKSTEFGEDDSTIRAIAAPVSNDPPPKSQFLELHKGRIFARNEEEKNELWYSALGEVRAFGNGAAEESFPGFSTGSQSLLQNFVDCPDQTSELITAKSWANVLWFFTRKEGFVLTGDGGLLDNSALRDFWPSTAFRIGCAGPQAVTTCPYGMVWMTPEHNLVLFSGASGPDPTAALIDLGYEKQKVLNQIDDRELERMQVLYYAPLNSLVLRFTTFDSTNHLLFYSFNIQDPQTGISGGWYEFTDVTATAIGLFFDRNKEFLLVGENDGEIRAIEQIVGNSVIGKSQALIGKIVLGGSSQIANYPAATFRTANTNLNYDGTKDCKKVYVYPHRQGNADDVVLSQNAPTIQFWDDVLDPDVPGSGTSVTLSTATKTRNFRGHLGAAGGTLADRIMVEAAFATGSPEGTADGNDFLHCHTSRINGFALVYAPKEEEFVNP